jgi:transmembrane sensor
MLGGAVAAGAACYLLAEPPFQLWPSLTEFMADYRTGTGEQHLVALPGGISIDMNTQTSIAVRSSPGLQRADLIAGEAMITTRLDPPRAFMLTAASGDTTAIDAAFNVRRDADTVCVTCLSGSVRVAIGGAVTELQPRQQTTYTGTRYSGTRLGPAIAVDPAPLTAWMSGLLIFHDKPLGDVLEEVNRYRPGRIVLTNPVLRRRLVNGVFHLDRIDGVIDQVRALGAHVVSLPGGLVVVS